MHLTVRCHVQGKAVAGIDVTYDAGRGIQPRVEEGGERVGGVEVRRDGPGGRGECCVEVLAVPGGAHDCPDSGVVRRLAGAVAA